MEDIMFADSVCDSAWSEHSHRAWTTLISFALQALALGSLLLLPLLYTEGLPRLALLAPLLVPAPPPSAPPTQRHNPPSMTQSNMMGNRLVAPPQIPAVVTMLTEAVPPAPAFDSSAFSVSHGMGDPNGRGNVMDSVFGSRVVAPPPPPAPHHPPVSRMMEGNLLHRVQPDYPLLARQVRVQGQVVLRAMISREGTIENLQVLSGHPMLVQAAVNAVRQWRYRPYVLNGEPVEVETQVTVNFHLSGG
jgi:periplasmic protein TonB